MDVPENKSMLSTHAELGQLKKKKNQPPAPIEFCLDSIHQEAPMSNQSPVSRGFLLQRYYPSFKFQKKEVFSKVEANVSCRTSHLVGKSSAVLCQRAAQDKSDTHCSLLDASQGGELAF